MVRVEIDQNSENASFWNELCGSQLAKSLGVNDAGIASLKRFDDWYFDYYPYLFRHIPFAEMDGKSVLEVGLGYGTVCQRLAESGAYYHGLDIARGPVEMARHRLKQIGLSGDVRQGSILECPFTNDLFDFVVAIGCYHHTGNLARAIEETRRILKPRGSLILMVYSVYSYRRWLWWPAETFSYFVWDKFGIGRPPEASDKERAAYDVDSKGVAAPETVFVSVGHLRHMASPWSGFRAVRENIGGESILSRIPRSQLLKTLGPWAGLDVYCHITK